MTLSTLVSTLRRLGQRSIRHQSELLSVRQFRQVLSRKRARSDRSGDRFSLLAFSPCESSTLGDLHRELLPILLRRLRATDEAGWLDRTRIAVVLPATPPRGAWRLAEDVCKTLAPAHEPVCRVYSYPSDSTQLDEAIRERQSHKDEHPVQSLELLFVQGLPIWKRAIDILGATVGLIALAPFLLGLAAAVRISSPGPIFFRQWRSGRGGRPFLMYKFRSMVMDAEQRKAALRPLSEQDGPAFKLRRDPRITPWGRFLRDTSLDELPQLWNVLKGDMSLVGPRPLPCDESAACLDWHKRRLDVTPGLTCIWQVSGRSRVTFNEWVRMDLEYVRRRSIIQDLKILITTVPAVLLRRGAK